MKNVKNQCEGRVFDGWRRRPCIRKASRREKGLDWCAIHAPSVVKAREAANEKKYKEECRELVKRNSVRIATATVVREAIKYVKAGGELPEDVHEATLTLMRLSDDGGQHGD